MKKKEIYLIVILVLSGIFLAQFNKVYLSYHTSFKTSGDETFGGYQKNEYPEALYSRWESTYLLGRIYSERSINSRSLPYLIFPLEFATKVFWTLPIILSMIFAWLYASVVTSSVFLRLFFTVSASLAPILVTYIFVGHSGKMHTISYIWMALYFFERYFRQDSKLKDKWLNIIGLAVAIGLAFDSWAVQTALYLTAFLTAYFIFRTFNQNYLLIKNIKMMRNDLLRYLIVPLISIFIAIPVLNEFLAYNAESDRTLIGIDENANLSVEEKKQKDDNEWGWATQWSFPPEEVIDLFLPKFFGVKSISWDNQKTYWGRTGRHINWSIKNGSSGANFSCASTYMGILPFILLLASLIYWRRSHEIKFLWIVAIIVLLLSFGRFFPLYSLFYELPLMDRFRNPNKFLHVLYFILLILSLKGGVFLIDSIKNSNLDQRKKNDNSKYVEANSQLKSFQIIIIVFLGLTIIGLGVFVLQYDTLQSYLQKIYRGNVPYFMMDNSQNAFFRFFFYFFMSIIAFSYLIYRKVDKTQKFLYIGFFLTLLNVIDLVSINKDYLDYIDTKGHQKPDELIKFIHNQTNTVGPVRIEELRQYGRNQYSWHLNTVNAASFNIQMLTPHTVRRAMNDYEEGYYKYIPNLIKLYKLLGVNYLLSVRSLGEGYAFHFKPFRNQEVYLYSLPGGSLPRAYIAHKYIVKTNREEGLKYLGGNEFVLGKEVVHFESGKYEEYYPLQFLNANSNLALVDANQSLSNSQLPINPALFSLNSTAKVLNYRNNYINIKVNMEDKGCLVFVDAHHDRWQAYVNGELVKIHKVNYIQRGVLLPKGEHIVEFKFKSNYTTIIISFIAQLLFLSLFILIFINNRNNNKKIQNDFQEKLSWT